MTAGALGGSKVGDASVRQVLALPALRDLDLADTATITPAAAALADLVTLESVDLIYLLDGAFGGEIMRECLTYSADGLRLGVLIVYQTESALDQLIAWMSQVQDAVQEYVKNIWPYCPNTQSRRHALLAAIHDGAPVWGCDEHQIYIPLGDLDNSR